MKNIYRILLDELKGGTSLCLAILVDSRGSVPQIPGSRALFTESGLMAGTLGGGVLEWDAGRKAAEVIRTGKSVLYEIGLDADIGDTEAAICGGSASVLLDPVSEERVEAFRKMMESLGNGKPGVLISEIPEKGGMPVRRSWFEDGKDCRLPEENAELRAKIRDCIEKSVCALFEDPGGASVFIEPIRPLPGLYIAGAGHIGKALAHQANLLDFEVTVIDDRKEYANPENIPDADHFIVQAIGPAMNKIPKTADSYVVIVTRGHKDDAEALKACIKHDLPYIGMIGSRKKIRMIKQKFIGEGWSTEEEFQRVHAPVGIEIGSVSVQEIALSIAAQLVRARAVNRKGKKREFIVSLILAAGESTRMGKPKMNLPFGSSSIIETVVSNAVNSVADRTCVILGADPETIASGLENYRVDKVLNAGYREGMLSSAQAGIRAMPPGTTAFIILLGDQPMISTEIIDRLIDHYKRSDKGIALACNKGRRGHPVIFSSRFIPEILSLGKEYSMKKVLENHPGDISEMETSNPEILRDIDTEEDYVNELKHL